MMTEINIPEKAVSEKFSFPLKTLKRLRSERKFDKTVCFTYPASTRIVYNVEAFKKWLEENKQEAHVDFNALIRSARERFFISNPEYNRSYQKRKQYR